MYMGHGVNNEGIGRMFEKLETILDFDVSRAALAFTHAIVRAFPCGNPPQSGAMPTYVVSRRNCRDCSAERRGERLTDDGVFWTTVDICADRDETRSAMVKPCLKI